MPGVSDEAAERRALELFERLTLDGDARAALTRDEPPEVLAALTRLQGASGRARRAFPTEEDRAPSRRLAPLPRMVGAYRLAGLLGEGGMGLVFAAERADGLFEHEVAIKLIHPDRFGEAGLARFARERRLLARLKHPAIARLIDGGITPEGWPYIIMEKMVGLPIDAGAEEAALDRRARVDLLLAVCVGVTAAHQALVVHGDIKPDNILVGLDGQVKLLDFGVARLVDDDSHHGLEPRTLAFSSPERRDGGPPSVSGDVFALGILMRSLLGEGEAGRPADARIAEPALAAIADKAAAPAPADRYRSVEELAADLARWRTGRPVRARGVTPAYAVERFVRRNRAGVALAMLILLALVVALVVSLRGWREARGREADLRDIARFQLVELDHRLDGQPRTMALRYQLAREALGYLDRLSRTPGASSALRRDAAEGFRRLAMLQGAPDRPSLGDAAAARASLAKAAALIADDPAARIQHAGILIDAARIAEEQVDIPAAATLLEGARAAASLTASPLATEWLLAKSEVAQWQGRFDAGAVLAARARARLPDGPATPETALRRVRSFDTEAEAVFYAHREAAARDLYAHALAEARAAAAHWPGDRPLRWALDRARWALATTELGLGHPRSALSLLTAAYTSSAADAASDPGDHVAARRLRTMSLAYGQALAAAGQVDAGVALAERSVAARQAWWARAPAESGRARDWVIGVSALGDILADAGRREQACRLYRRATAAAVDLSRRGRSTGLDRNNAFANLQVHQTRSCPDAPTGSG